MTSSDDEEVQAVGEKSKRRTHDVEEKLKAVELSRKKTVARAAKSFGVGVLSIYRWRKQVAQLKELSKKRKHLSGGGRPLKCDAFDENVFEWMVYSDAFRRRVIWEVRYEPEIWDLTHPSSKTFGARSYAWQTIAWKLRVADRALDLRRMWRGWLRSYVNYPLRTTNRKPKYYDDMHFLGACSLDHILSFKYRF